jgi:hypothetical protein
MGKQSDVQPAIDKLLTFAEQSKFPIVLPVILCTNISGEACDFLRELIATEHEGAKELLETATDYHNTAFVLPQSDERSIRLMEMH